jgi:chromosome segregation ATPase
MSEPILFIGFGILLALSLIYGVRLFRRSRVGRLTLKKLENVAPRFLTDIETDMAQMHAQIAVATRRLEAGVEQMKSKTSSQLREIAGTTEAIARLKSEHAEVTVALGAIEARERAAVEQLRTAEAQLSVRTEALKNIENRLMAAKAELKDVLTFVDARDKLAQADSRHEAAMQKVLAEKAEAEEQVKQAHSECLRLQHDMQAMKKQVESTWASERMANALLRERINDVAGEVVRVAHALEGLSSPIDTMMAGKAAELDAALGAVAGTNGNAPVADDSKGLLAHRIRSLQKRAARVASSGGT